MNKYMKRVILNTLGALCLAGSALVHAECDTIECSTGIIKDDENSIQCAAVVVSPELALTYKGCADKNAYLTYYDQDGEAHTVLDTYLVDKYDIAILGLDPVSNDILAPFAAYDSANLNYDGVGVPNQLAYLVDIDPNTYAKKTTSTSDLWVIKSKTKKISYLDSGDNIYGRHYGTPLYVVRSDGSYLRLLGLDVRGGMLLINNDVVDAIENALDGSGINLKKWANDGYEKVLGGVRTKLSKRPSVEE